VSAIQYDAISLQSTLANLVLSRFASSASGTPRIGALQRNYFSFIFAVEDAARGHYIVKIPKTDLRIRPEEGVLPLTAHDRAMGRAEYESLQVVARTWNAEDLRVNWVKPIAYIDEYNAVVTEHVAADEVYLPFRLLALRQLVGDRSAGLNLNTFMSRMGCALARFHAAHGRPISVSGAALAARLRNYVERLAASGASLPSAALIETALSQIARISSPSIETATLKGIDIRNVLVARDGHFWLVDPGKTKRAPREADLARFLLTWRILFWGTPWFSFGIVPHSQTEAAFLRAYDANRPRDPVPLRIFLLKETLKHWLTAYDSVALKPWPTVKSVLVKRMYIDRFYRRQTGRLLQTFI